MQDSATSFLLTTVYGPSRRNEKPAFLQHLRSLRPAAGVPWLVLGDFNLIYRARDKNNTNLNLRLMARFRAAINFCGLKEIHLQNRKFTWSNERRRPTLSRLDRFFCNSAWDLSYDNHLLHALSSTYSDHCPLLLARHTGPRRPTPFKLENFWVKLPRFQEIVTQAWTQQTTHTEPFHRLGHKLYTTSRALRNWSRSLISDAKLNYLMAQEVILRLDTAQEHRQLSDAQYSLRAKLKKRLLGWATESDRVL